MKINFSKDGNFTVDVKFEENELNWANNKTDSFDNFVNNLKEMFVTSSNNKKEIHINDKNNENKNSNLSKIIFQKIANNLTYNSGDIYFKIPTKSKPFSLSNKETGRTSNVYYTI